METSTDRLPLVLGTAQLGLNYGIANKEGKPSLDRSLEIVAEAWSRGIRFFDTARAYGDSEEVLGRCLREIANPGKGLVPAVISKLDPHTDLSCGESVLKEADTSLKNLGLDTLWGLMLHRESLLDQWGPELHGAVARLKQEKKVRYFGVSVYSPERAIQALSMQAIDIVQLPFNVLDQRPLQLGLFQLAEEKGKRVFTRSVYLQGLLLMDPDHLPARLLFAKPVLEQFVAFSRAMNLSPRLLAMAFAVQKSLQADLVIGCETPAQVRENVSTFHQAKTVDLPDLAFLAQKEPKLINPSLWPQ